MAISSRSTLRCLPLALALLALLALLAPSVRAQRAAPAAERGAAVSAPVGDISYTVTFDEAVARTGTVRVTMAFTTGGAEPVVLSLPAWTPGAYELSYFARWVSDFAATGDGKPLAWDKVDHDTWRVRPGGAKSVSVSFTYTADSLDNAMTWARPDFLLFNGTNLFLYPEGRPFDFAATVRIQTAPTWLVATGMTAAGAPRTYTASSFHDLVDMPFFVGRFDLDSARIADRWVRFASYPAGSVSGPARAQVWDQLRRLIPPQVAVFGETPWTTYTVMQVADSSYGGASGLEHQNSHVNVIAPGAIGHPFMPSLYAHEIFHAWNVKRLRPAALWPYQYAREQPTEWLWVSEGITDYYADLAEVRGGVRDSSGFFALTAGKIQEVSALPPVALEDASLSTWIHPADGTGYVYYAKGSLAGLMLDILIRDASDNRRSLDDVMRAVYQQTYKQGRGFTGDDWWRAVSAAAGGRSFADFDARFIDGREPYPWDSILPLAGMRLAVDTILEPRLGVTILDAGEGFLITGLTPGGGAQAAGIRPGDLLLSVGDIPASDPQFLAKLQARIGDSPEGATLPVRLRRGAETLTLDSRIRLEPRYEMRIEADARAGAKARRIRSGLLRGTVDR